jgi:membrane protein implicated in regulation of membrane protease activity
MQQYRFQITGPGRGSGPGFLARIAMTVAAVAVLVTAALLGAIFFLAALGFFAIAVMFLAVRIWWAKRKFEQAARRGEPSRDGNRKSGARAEVIEGEYRVLRPREGRHRADKDGGDL